MYQSTKTYGHELGLSATFRQWRATHSHCSKLHGYALAVTLVFETGKLDHRNWVQDFGGLKEIKQYLQDTFDHKTIISEDDPELERFRMMARAGVLDLVILPAVGCEAFATIIYDYVDAWLWNQAQADMLDTPRVWLQSVEVREHGANSARYVRPSSMPALDPRNLTRDWRHHVVSVEQTQRVGDVSMTTKTSYGAADGAASGSMARADESYKPPYASPPQVVLTDAARELMHKLPDATLGQLARSAMGIM